MLRDLRALLPRGAATLLADARGMIPLDAYLDQRGYGHAFRDDHLLPDGGGDLVDAGGTDRRLSRPRPSCASARTTAC